MQIEKVKDIVFQKLRHETPADLSFHDLNHTKDVLDVVMRLTELEDIKGEELTILRTAAILHDIGYIKQYKNHEQTSCEFAREILPEHGYNTQQVEKVCELIMATKLPQDPKDKLGEILCDADLDYLGRNDYFFLTNSMFEEFKAYGLVSDERDWNLMQKNFLESHSYYTESARKLREDKKQAHLLLLMDTIESYLDED